MHSDAPAVLQAPDTRALTRSGRLVDVLKPDPASIELTDIAWGLARQRRFLGQTAISINIAAHSRFVAWIIARIFKASREAIFGGLLHDAHEYIIGDWPTPAVNALAGHFEDSYPLPDFAVSALKSEVDQAIAAKLNLKSLSSDDQWLIKRADRIALEFEGRVGFGKNWRRTQIQLIDADQRDCAEAALAFHCPEPNSAALDAELWLNDLANNAPSIGVQSLVCRALDDIRAFSAGALSIEEIL